MLQHVVLCCAQRVATCCTLLRAACCAAKLTALSTALLSGALTGAQVAADLPVPRGADRGGPRVPGTALARWFPLTVSTRHGTGPLVPTCPRSPLPPSWLVSRCRVPLPSPCLSLPVRSARLALIDRMCESLCCALRLLGPDHRGRDRLREDHAGAATPVADKADKAD